MLPLRVFTRAGYLELPPVELLPLDVLNSLIPETTERGGVSRDGIIDLLVTLLDTTETLDKVQVNDLVPIINEWERLSSCRLVEAIRAAILIKNHGRAIAADLIRDGMRLRDFPDERHTWDDLLTYSDALTDCSALFGSVHPDFAGWTRESRLAAMQYNVLQWIAWSKTKDGRKGKKRPKPIGPDMADKTPPRAGLKPRPSKLSVVKRMLGLERPQSMRDVVDTERKIGNLFGG